MATFVCYIHAYRNPIENLEIEVLENVEELAEGAIEAIEGYDGYDGYDGDRYRNRHRHDGYRRGEYGYNDRYWLY